MSKAEKKMNQEAELLKKKSMTKKAYRESLKAQRSVVAAGMNTGTRTMTTVADYDRKKVKKETRKMMREFC